MDLGAIAANWQTLCRHHPSGPVAAVLKADAYGLGAIPVAERLYALGCRHVMVATVPEAVALRRVLPDALIVTLSGLPGGTEAQAASRDIAPALGSLDEIGRWSATARRLGRPLPALLHIDTGMSRLGLPQDELTLLRREPARLDGIEVRFVMTHLASADCAGHAANAEQLAAFRAVADILPDVPRSFANSSGVFLGAAFGSALARAGAALYGVNPQPGSPNPMRQVARLTASVLQVRDIPAGTAVGYEGTWRAARPSRIATIGIGYADGWRRALSNRGAAVFDGRTVPLVGRISMDLTTYDVTGTTVAVGDWLELLGPARPLDQVAEDFCTNAYEVLTSLGPRIARTYHG